MSGHTNGWSFLHCLRSSAKRALQIPDICSSYKKETYAADGYVDCGPDERLGNSALFVRCPDPPGLVRLQERKHAHHNRMEHDGGK